MEYRDPMKYVLSWNSTILHDVNESQRWNNMNEQFINEKLHIHVSVLSSLHSVCIVNTCFMKYPPLVTCYTDLDCSISEVCLQGVCQLPCSAHNPCAQYAVCVNTNRGPDCSCLEGYQGNGFVGCIPGLYSLNCFIEANSQIKYHHYKTYTHEENFCCSRINKINLPI